MSGVSKSVTVLVIALTIAAYFAGLFAGLFFERGPGAVDVAVGIEPVED